MHRKVKKASSLFIAAAILLASLVFAPGVGTLRASAAGWNGTNYGGGSDYGYRTFLEAYGIDYHTYMKWMDDHDADSPNPNYYLGTPYVGEDHRNPRGDCSGAYGDFDEPGVAAMNCTGFVWHVLYKAAVNSGASWSQINQLRVMSGVTVSWANNGVYRIYFDSLDDAYKSGIMEKGDVMWIYGSDDSHNAIFYGDDPHDWIYWDSAGERNRYCAIHSIGTCLGVWVAKVTQPDQIELNADTVGGDRSCFGAKYSIFTSRAEAQAALDNPSSDALWDKRIGTIALDATGHGALRTQNAPSKAELWRSGVPQTGLSYFSSEVRRVDASNTYYAVQWSGTDGVPEDNVVHVLKDSGRRTSTGYRVFSFNVPKKVADPEISELKSTFDGVKISWNAVKGAERYRVYRKTGSGSWTRLGETASTSFVDTKAVAGRKYTYTLRCVNSDGSFTSNFNETGWSHTHSVLATPELVGSVSEPNGIHLRWDPVEGAYRYRLYFKNSKGSWVRVVETANTEFTDGVVTAGNSYIYTVRCVDKDGDFVSDFNRNGLSATYVGIDAPVITELVSEAEGIRLKWNAVENAAKYRLYCRSASGQWSKIADTDSTEFVDEIVTAGHSYTYTIRCLNLSGSLSSGFNADGWTQKYDGVATPRITKAVNEPEGIKLSWNAVENAKLYRIYYKDYKGSWVRVGATAATEFLDKDVRAGKTYTYTLRCVNGKGGFMSDYDRTGVAQTFWAQTPVIVKTENLTSGIRLTWNKVPGAYSYRVFYKGSGGWTRLGVTTGTSFIDSDVSSGSTYTYTVRCMNEREEYVSDYNKDGFKATYISTPRIKSAVSTTGGIKLSWDAVKGAYGYRVFYYNNGWKRLASTTSTFLTDTDVRSGSTYYYTVRCIDRNDNYVSDYYGDGYKATYIAAPVITRLSSGDSGMVIGWNAVKGAYSYRVFRRGSNGWERLGVTTGTAFIDKNVTDGSSYTYTVRCMDGSGNYISDYYGAGFTAKYTKPADKAAVSADVPDDADIAAVSADEPDDADMPCTETDGQITE